MMHRHAFFLVILALIFGISIFSAGNAAAKGKDYKVAWQSMVDDEFQIFLMDLKNPTEPKQLTFGKYGSKHPSITADGSRIYYYHWLATNWGDMNLLYYQNLPGGKETQFQTNAIHQEQDPCISRDGSVLAFQSFQSIVSKTGTQPGTDNWEIVCTKTDFSVASRITYTKNEETDPCLNEDGSAVYFTIKIEKDRTESEKQALRDAAEEKKKLEKEEAKGEVKTEIFEFGKYDLLNSPMMFNPFILYPGMGGGGSTMPPPKMLKEEDDDGDKKKSNPSDLDEESWEFNHYYIHYIFRNNFEGDDLVRITPRDYNAWHPSVDANEKWMVFVSDMDGNDEIYLMDLSNWEYKRLTEYEGYDGSPSISADGEIIVFVSDRDGDKEIFQMDRSGNNLVQLTYNDVDDENPSIT